MSTSEKTTEEMIESLTGFDEIAITQHMGLDVYMDAQAKPIPMTRALIFIDQKRQHSLADGAARSAALSMTLKDVQAYFADVPQDEDEADEQGKDEPAPGLTPIV